MNFRPYFPHLLSDFGEFLFSTSVHNAVEYRRVPWKSAQGTPYFPCVGKWNQLHWSVYREAVRHFGGRERLSQNFLLRHRVNRLLSCYMFTVHRPRVEPRPGRGGGLFCRGPGTADCRRDDWAAIGRSDRLLYYYKHSENIISISVWWANAYRMGSSNSLATKFCACACTALLVGIISWSVDSTYIGWCLSCLNALCRLCNTVWCELVVSRIQS
jgi:hypothetical protein